MLHKAITELFKLLLTAKNINETKEYIKFVKTQKPFLWLKFKKKDC